MKFIITSALYLTLIAFLFIPVQNVNGQKNDGDHVYLKASKVSSVKTSAEVDSDNLPPSLTLRENLILPAEGYNLWSVEDGGVVYTWVFTDRQIIAGKFVEGGKPKILSFEVLGGARLEGGIQEYYYCSCGNNTFAKEGDNCTAYEKPDEGIQCGGTCTKGEAGETCSITALRIEADGSITKEKL